MKQHKLAEGAHKYKLSSPEIAGTSDDFRGEAKNYGRHASRGQHKVHKVKQFKGKREGRGQMKVPSDTTNRAQRQQQCISSSRQ